MSKDTYDRDAVLAARQAKKSNKQKGKNKDHAADKSQVSSQSENKQASAKAEQESPLRNNSNDEVDRANTAEAPDVKTEVKDKEQIKAQREAKKAAKQAKKHGIPGGDTTVPPVASSSKVTDLTVKDLVETLREIKVVAQDVKHVTAEVKALDLHAKKNTSEKPKAEEANKSKAELKAERRAIQEAQRAAKQAAAEEKAAAAKPKEKPVPVKPEPTIEKSPKPKSATKTVNSESQQRITWFNHLKEKDVKEKLNSIPLNSNLHPAIIQLGVQLATKVVKGSNARCVALLDAIKKMLRDYSLPAKTEFGRGFEAQLTASLAFLWTMRQPTASQTNAVKFIRHRLSLLPNNVDEFDAKKSLQEEIDRYIREQIEMAGEAISITVRNKIADGDNILTYGCSSLIERILVDAHEAGVQFRAVVCGGGGTADGAREMSRRLAARGVATTCLDITAIHYVMGTIAKVLVGCSTLLVNGSVVGAAGTAAVALAARAHNTPVLVACETHKFSEGVHTDAFVANEIGDPEDLLGESDESSPLTNWKANPNITALNVMYDVTPPNLITAVVTELAILPCTSAPVVLRFKLSEYSL